jgi:hypothetical protein
MVIKKRGTGSVSQRVFGSRTRGVREFRRVKPGQSMIVTGLNSESTDCGLPDPQVQPECQRWNTTMTQIKCCRNCPCVSTSSGISQHHKTCDDYKSYRLSIRTFWKDISEAVPDANLSNENETPLLAQQVLDPGDCSGTPIDDMVSHIKYPSCLCRKSSPSPRFCIIIPISLGQALVPGHQHFLGVQPNYPHRLLPYHCQGGHNEPVACQLDIRTHSQKHQLLLLYLYPILLLLHQCLRAVLFHACLSLYETGFRLPSTVSDSGKNIYIALLMTRISLSWPKTYTTLTSPRSLLSSPITINRLRSL